LSDEARASDGTPDKAETEKVESAGLPVVVGKVRVRERARKEAFRWIYAAYMVALVVALMVGGSMSGSHPLLIALAADVAATFVIFCFSFAFGNSSFYDAYWSVAPLPIAIYWAATAPLDASIVRQVVVIALVLAWGARLTSNWAQGWTGLSHEDWRYEKFRESYPRAYWFISFGGIHMMPTLWVFGGLLPVYAAVGVGTQGFGVIDLVATAITGGAIWVEARADRELRAFKAGGPDGDEVLSSGLWSLSRHPNYFGEMTFWWGLFMFALAADPAYWWTGIGAVSITLMFKFASLPLIEDHMRERRPGYDERTRGTSLVVPWPKRRGGAEAER